MNRQDETTPEEVLEARPIPAEGILGSVIAVEVDPEFPELLRHIVDFGEWIRLPAGYYELKGLDFHGLMHVEHDSVVHNVGGTGGRGDAEPKSSTLGTSVLLIPQERPRA